MDIEIIGGESGSAPSVGQTIHCTQPVVSDGIGPFQFDYGWTENNSIIFEQRYLGCSMLLTNEEAGKTMACIVTVSDKGVPGSMSIQVKSNNVGPILPAS